MSNNKNDVLTVDDLEGQEVLELPTKKKTGRPRKYATLAEKYEAKNAKRRNPPLTEEQKLDLLEHLGKSNYKYVKNQRINLSVTPSTYKYMRALQDDTHQPFSKLINSILMLYREQHPEPTAEDNQEILEYIKVNYTYGSHSFTAEDSPN